MAAQDVVARLQRRIMPVGGSQLGKPYGMHNLLHDCKTGMITEDVLKRVWSSLTDYIYEKLNQPQPRGVVITDFGTFSRFKTGHLLFRAAPEFKKNLSLIEPSNAPQVPSLNLPYTAVAIPAQVTQDTASIAVRRMVQELAVQARNGLTLTIPMGRLGVLWSRGRTVGFRFETKKKSTKTTQTNQDSW